jgi:hypothetical protein
VDAALDNPLQRAGPRRRPLDNAIAHLRPLLPDDVRRGAQRPSRRDAAPPIVAPAHRSSRPRRSSRATGRG